MPLAVVIEQNSLAAKYASDVTHLSAHTGDPGLTGANEISGGSPAYARKPITWSTPSGGQITGTVTFDIPAGTNVAYIGCWDALTGGNFRDKGQVTLQSFASQGQYTVTATYTQT